MWDYEQYKRELPRYVIVNVEDLNMPETNELPIRNRALPFEFPLSPEDKIDVALVMERFRIQALYSGLSAPQLGLMKRLIVFAIPRKETTDPCRIKVFLNPTYEKIGDNVVEDIECCVSIKGVVAPVPRYETIRYTTYDIKGNYVEGEISGTGARLIQHEVDHLDGKLFTDLVTPDKYRSFSDFAESLRNKQAEIEDFDSS